MSISPEQPASGEVAAESPSRNLLRRVLAALVLAPLAIAIAWTGGWVWSILVVLAAIGLFVEWLTIVGAMASRVLITGGLSLALTGLALTAHRPLIALLTFALGLAAVGFGAEQRRGWASGGLVYAGAALAGSILLRSQPTYGFEALFFVLLVVWVTDIGGYFAGRGIGGPKLWPRVSPKKTWAGAIGGVLASLCIALLAAAVGAGRTAPLIGLSVVLSVVAQCGDLFESAVKRRFGVKDSSQIIPGHGGLLDRLDGFVAAVVLAVLVGASRGGMSDIAGGLMQW